jgi:magnesium transporter
VDAEEVRQGATIAGGELNKNAGSFIERVPGDVVAAEGTVQDETGEGPGAVSAWLFQPDAGPRQVDLAEVPVLITVDENLVWIDASEYSTADLEAVARAIGIHDRSVSSALSPWERPRLDVLTDHYSVSCTVAEIGERPDRITARQLDCIVGLNFLVTAHKQPLPFYDSLFARATHEPDLVRLDSGFMLYIVLDELLEDYEALEERMRGEIERMQEDAVYAADGFLRELVQVKRATFVLTQLLQQHERIFEAFLRPDFSGLGNPELQQHFRDLHDRLLRLIDRLEGARQEVNYTSDIYLSHQTHRTNNVVKTLTMVATALFSATFIEGIFSPSFHGVPTHTPAAFVVMLALIAAVFIATVYLFRRRGWM